MTDETRTRMRRLVDRIGRLSPAALALVGIVIVAAVSGAGFYAYQTYDYVEHDNEFCFSCHLMQEPYELFAQSAHRGLGCKACHQPNLMGRSQMAITAVVENPDTIAVHADVPNDLCASCHIEGDPEQWTLIASSAGHRVHLESDDPALEGLQCVECHSSSLHQFTAADQTCAQSGCHTDAGIQLGAMSDLTIHCAACHGFSAPTVDEADAALALSPDEETCLSCHAMRVLVELPEPDPHEGSCASCHNPHEQTTPAEAAQSCSSSQCHSDPEALTPFHEGLDDGVLGECMYCHQAHDFAIDGENCAACHQNVMQDDPGAVRQSASREGFHGAGVPALAAGVPGAGAPSSAAPPSALAPGASLLHSWGYPLPQTLDFRHSDHPDIDCAQCHQSTEQHGEVTVTTVTDCRSCHHSETTVLADGCAACHEESGTTGDPYSETRTMTFSTGSVVERELPFDHEAHVSQECATCHTEGLELSAADVECASCHVEHHQPLNDCMSCHAEPEDDAHTVDVAHVTCSGAGCHTPAPFEGLPRTRPFCLSCHQDQVDHRPGGDCAECHALSEVG
jgi:nitrate/TMAO reductase-like tetraheme cytochrome c subunit